MKATNTAIPGVIIVEPDIRGDARGWLVETYHADRYAELGIPGPFVQDNSSHSAPGILRGLHLQHPKAQGKLVWAMAGRVLDVAVDVRVGSPTFGKHVAVELDSTRKNQLWIPAGFAHGFCVMGDVPATLAYKCTELYAPQSELTVLWNDPELGIEWPVAEPTLSEKDRNGMRLAEIDPGRLPGWEA